MLTKHLHRALYGSTSGREFSSLRAEHAEKRMASDIAQYSNPPIWEMGISAGFEPRNYLNTYDIRMVHDLVREKFPNVERQVPFPGLEPYPVIGMAVPTPQIQLMTVPPSLSRWWLIDQTGANLFQIQENFAGRNWRRLALPPDPAPVPYPGFAVLMADFRHLVDKLHADADSEGYLPYATPSIVELLYEDLIPLDVGGERLRIRDVLEPLKFKRKFPLVNLNLSWLEKIETDSEVDRPNLQVQATQAGLAGANGLMPYVRLAFRAREPVKTWSEAYRFLGLAHDRIRDRLADLTTERCRSTWDPS